MIYIEKLELKNFQSHYYTEINFDRGLNVILGNSDSGKTAIIRAIRWALYNDPRGDYFIRQGERDVSVKITFSNGGFLERYRTPSKNGYYIKKPNGEEERFENFGNTIPKEVTELTNIYEVTIEKNKNSILNISAQLEGPFLLNESPSTRAAAIGRLIGVNYIDDALRNVRRDNLRLNSDITNLNDESQRLKEELKKYEYLESYKEIYKTLKSYRERIENLQNKRIKLKEYAINLSDINQKIDSTLKELKKYKSINKLEKDAFSLEKYIYNHIKLKNLNIKQTSINEEIENLQIRLESLKDIQICNKYKNIISEKSNLLNRYEILSNRYKSLIIEFKKINSISHYYSNIKELQDLIEVAQSKIDKIKLINNYNISYKDNKKSLNIGNNYYNNFKHLDELFILVDNKLKYLNHKYNYLTSIKERIEPVNYEINEIKNNLNICKDRIKKFADEYEKIIIESHVCPFCYREITKESLDHIKYHLRND